MQTTVQERIVELIKAKAAGVSKDFCELTGIPESTMSSILGSRQTSPGFSVLHKIAAKFDDVNMNWLVKGDDSPTYLSTTIQRQDKGNILYITNQQVAAGFLAGFADGSEFERIHIPGFEGTEKKYLLQVYGDSMYPFITSGDMVICRQIFKENLRIGEPYVVATQRDGVVVKRIKSINNETLTLESDNAKYGPYDVYKNEIEGIYQILGVVTFNTGERIIIKKVA